MKCYETLFVLKATLTEEEAKARVETIRSLLEKNGAEISLVKEYGIRPLAYEIGKSKRGYFVNIFFKAPPSTVIELERVYRITEDIIKFITIKFENKKEIQAWENGSKTGITSILRLTQKAHNGSKEEGPDSSKIEKAKEEESTSQEMGQEVLNE